MMTTLRRLTCRIGVIAAIAMSFIVMPAKAQTDAQFSQYYEVPTFYNPGAVGQTDLLRIRGGARMQWVGIDNAPRTFIATADMPLRLGKQRIGLGVIVNQESAGLYKSLNLGAQLAYKLRKLGGEFTIGLQLGMYDQAFKGSEVYLPDGDDYHEGTDEGIPTQDIHGTAFDVGAGIWYVHKYFHAGISCTHLTSPTIAMNVESASGGSETSSDRRFEFQARRTLYFMAGCNIPIKNTLFELQPSALVRSDFTFTSWEATLRCRYNKFISAGVGYRWKDAVYAVVAAEIKGFYIGFTYDYPTGAIVRATSGSYEIMAGYQLKLDFSERNRHRHKSVRIM